LRQASAPIAYSEIAQLKELFEQQPKLEKELARFPESIRDPAFLNSHAPLHDFLRHRPALAQVFLPAVAAVNHD